MFRNNDMYGVFIYVWRQENKKEEVTKLSYDIDFAPIIWMLSISLIWMLLLISKSYHICPSEKKTEQPTLLHLTEMWIQQFIQYYHAHTHILMSNKTFKT